MKDQARFKRICIICFIAMLVMFVVHVQILVMFNRKEVTVHGSDSSSSAYMDIGSRDDSTSSWVKTDFPMTEDELVILHGQTIDGTLYNDSGDTIQEWGLRINIAGDCFINQAWTGEVEIHQYAGTDDENVQRLNLQNYDPESITLEHRFHGGDPEDPEQKGDLLIPLQKGDYVLYFPNEASLEMPLPDGSNKTIGVIFYYLDDLDLSDYDLTVHFHRGFTQGWSFIVFIVLAALWIISAAIYGTGVYIYRNEQKQMELRKSGLSGMSELYAAIYVINLPTGETTPVSEGEYLEELRTKYTGAKELLYNAVKDDAVEAHLDTVVDFVNTDTLAERLKDRDSIVCEFVSRQHGWTSFRFFAMDRTEGKPPENVVFTVQDINEERTEMKKIVDRLEKAEAVSTANIGFLSAASRDLQAPVRELISLDEEIMQETDPEKIQSHVKSIHSVAERMLVLINGMTDRAGIEAGKVKPAAQPYSLEQLLTEAFSAVAPAAEKRQLRLERIVTEGLPDRLTGDAARLKEIIVSLLADTISRTTEGSIRLSVFGKAQGDVVHLLFSIRSAPENETPSEELPGLNEAGTEPDLDLEIAGSLLRCMGSGLKTVRSSDAWQEKYFEIDQRIADSAPADSDTAEDNRQ